MARELRKRHVWVDLAHASEAAELELAAEFKGLPLLHTHTSLRRHLGAERGISDAQLARVGASGGIIGLMTSEDYLEGTPEQGCPGGVRALATQYREAAAVVGAEGIAMGSDYNGGVPHLHPEAGACALGAGLDAEGLWNIGQVPELWASLEKLGAPVPKPRAKMIERFLDAWKKW
jgi:microsomal dipeptidase-like Zn-dependent dipeptidase